MAMSNLYSKIAPKPVKRIQDNMAVSQTNAWMNGKDLQLVIHWAFVNTSKNGSRQLALFYKNLTKSLSFASLSRLS